MPEVHLELLETLAAPDLQESQVISARQDRWVCKVQVVLPVLLVTLELWASLVSLVHRVTEDQAALRDSEALLDRVDLTELLDK